MTTRPSRTPIDDRLAHPLERLRGGIRRYVLLDGLLFAGIFLVFWFWLGLAADWGLFKLTGFDWVQDAPKGLRVLALFVLAVLLFGILVTRLAIRLTRTFSYPSLALVLERRFPGRLGDRLITAVELADVQSQAKYGYSEDMIRQTVTEARERVDQLPVDGVFNWRRIRVHGWLLGGVAVGMLVLAFLGYSAVSRTLSPGGFGWRFADVAAIWGERNLLLRDTPWPRRAHLELIDFLAEELRVGKDAPPPKVRAVAYRWVIADRGSRDGWRPLRWADLTRAVLGVPPPDVTALAVAGADGKPAAADASGWAVDQVEAAAGTAPAVRDVLDRLDKLAAQPRNSRRLRKLVVPDAVTLSYFGAKTRGSLSLTREKGNEFSGEVSGLKESVRFVVKGEDFTTAPRLITLVPPPALTGLKRSEQQPAYLYHAPPVDVETAALGRLVPPGGAATPKQREEALAEAFRALKGRRQVFADRALSLTGDKSVVTVLTGTELTLTGVADKRLKEVLIRPLAGNIPGVPPGSAAPLRLTTTPHDDAQDQFTLRFEGEHRITQPVEFEVVLVDFDDVTSTRKVLIQSTEDQAPVVEVAVDVVRKVGNSYLVTPAARVPFVPESYVRDDTGLSRVAFEFGYSRQEAQVVVGLQANALATVFAAAPAMPGLPAAFGSATGIALAQLLTTAENKQLGDAPVRRFADAFGSLERNTLDLLTAKLGQPVNADRPNVVKEIKFQDQGRDVFDLEQSLPGIYVREEGAVQPRYKLEVNVVAADVNVDGGPKVGRGAEPLRFLVVSEADLLAEMAKDEENLIAKIDDVLKRLREARRKLDQATDPLGSSPTPPNELITAASVRTQDAAQDLGKSKDVASGVLTEYLRLRREAEVNRCREQVIARFAELTTERKPGSGVEPLEAILNGYYPPAEDAFGQLTGPLAAGRRPDEGQVLSAKQNLDRLIDVMTRLRDQLGEALSLNKFRDDLRKLIENQKSIERFLVFLRKNLYTDLEAPRVAAVPPVVLNRGETATVRHPLDWQAFAGSDYRVRFEAPADAGLTLPAEVKVPDDKNEVEYPVTAGDKAGEFAVTLVPSVGRPVPVKIVVK